VLSWLTAALQVLDILLHIFGDASGTLDTSQLMETLRRKHPAWRRVGAWTLSRGVSKGQTALQLAGSKSLDRSFTCL
jgi:hypothetical protein